MYDTYVYTYVQRALNYTLAAKGPKQQIWGISGGLGGLNSGGLLSRATESEI